MHMLYVLKCDVFGLPNIFPGQRAQDAAKPRAESLPQQPSVSSQVLSGPSPPESQKMLQKSPRGSATVRRPDFCVSCGLIGTVNYIAELHY